MSLLSKEEQKKVDSLFKKREYRLVAIELLTSYTHEPDLHQGRELAERYDMTTRQLRRVVRMLKENQLFTEKEGSIPLYRKTLQTTTRIPSTPDTPSKTGETIVEEENTVIQQGVPLEPREEYAIERQAREFEEKQDNGQYDERFEDLELKFSGLNTRMKGVDQHLLDIKDFMGQITGQLGQAQQTTPEQPQQQPQQETHIQPIQIDDNPSLPYQLEETVNPSIASIPNTMDFPGFVHANPDELVEMEGQIIAIKSVGFVPKSLMLFDIVKNRGFTGNLADFVNSCISDAFKSRKVKLVISDEEEIL